MTWGITLQGLGAMAAAVVVWGLADPANSGLPVAFSRVVQIVAVVVASLFIARIFGVY